MVNMEVTIISKQNVKPSSSSSHLHLLKPYKLCLFDQLTPVTYPSFIFFYPISDPNFNLRETLVRLKKSLSETLTLYFPFSGRTKNNLYIDDFHEGLVYLEAKVNYRMSDYFKLKDIELLNLFIPYQPFCKEKETLVPQIAFQVNLFACGGIALGVSTCHKVSDGNTVSYLLKSWAAIFSGSPDKVIHPDLAKSSSLFPPRHDMPLNYSALMDHLWFKESNYVTRRFVFNAESISKLRAKAKSESVPEPSRIETLTCFIWKQAMAASWKLSGSTRTSVVAHAVNLRSRMKPNSLGTSTGNMFWWGLVAANPSETEIELHDLVRLLKEALAVYDNKEFLEALQGEHGFSAVSDFMDQVETMLSMESEKPDIFAFTRWTNSFFNEVDFGWGKPYWLGVMGKVGPAFRNLVIFVDTQWGKGIEAWITLEDRLMAVLENDPGFLAFASPNPHISSL
ncbi:hypothetical protein FNV43_RR25141 [Rhamnella rubrinervis]|uniref:Uncharacterized protein n=1 Tax=Rhamnella rubrinervis TaxID=2594499 RepID=A0A8K0GRC9_9ROSA|nr:hypothetical protein FNV43_RR25141 [Rhamnella rubrinervis]